jgi:hypothetical protein
MGVNCPDEGRLRAYLDGELPHEEQIAAGRHVSHCPACEASLALLRSDASAVAAAFSREVPPAISRDGAWQRLVARQPQLAGPARDVASVYPVAANGVPGAAVPAASPLAKNARRASHSAEYLLHLTAWRLSTMFQNLRGRGWQIAVPAVVLVALLVSVATIDPVRAAAAQFLDVFRVKKLTVVQVQTGQLEKLQQYRDQVFSKPDVQRSEPAQVTSSTEASSRAGFTVLVPGFVPPELSAQKFVVESGGHATTQVNLRAARTVLQMANLPTDMLPAGKDSVQVSANLKPGVAQEYKGGGHELSIVQAQSPEVQVPDGIDLAKVNEVGLQLLGLSPDAAKRLSQNVDWATTLVLPVPADVGSVREITVRGNPGYLISETREIKHQGGPRSIVLWQENGLLYGVAGDYGQSVLLQVAESLK